LRSSHGKSLQRLRQATGGPRLWKLPPGGNGGKINSDFSTVPTGLGKLSVESTPSFPQFPQPLLLGYINEERKTKANVPGSLTPKNFGRDLDIHIAVRQLDAAFIGTGLTAPPNEIEKSATFLKRTFHNDLSSKCT